MATTKPDLTRTWASGAPGANVVDPDVTTPGKFAAGWIAEIPPFEHFNYLQQVFSQGLGHFNEQGIGVWDSSSTYPLNGLAKGSDGNIYTAVLEQAGNDPVSDDGTNWVLWFTNYSSVKGGRKNLLINGNFSIWQRGNSFTAASEYGPDRWIIGTVGTTHTTSRQNFTLGQTAVPGEPKHYSRSVVNSVAGAGNYYNYVQRVESVRTLAGQEFTFSFWAKADATKNISIEMFQNFGTGGSPSAGVSSNVNKISISNTWQRYTITGTLPSISGKTLGLNDNDHLAVTFWFEAGSDWNSRTETLGQQSGTFDIANAQIEEGPSVTDFEKRDIDEELTRCQRYFQQWEVFLDTYNTSGQFVSNAVNYMTQMRTTPTTAVVTDSSVNVSSISTAGTDVKARATGTADITGHTTLNVIGTADAEL